MQNPKCKEKNQQEQETDKEPNQLKGEFELPVSLEELAIYANQKGRPIQEFIKTLDTETEKVNEKVKKILTAMKEIKDWKVSVQSVTFDYCDSHSPVYGVAYFKVMLKGTKESLKKISRTDWPFTQKEEEKQTETESGEEKVKEEN